MSELAPGWNLEVEESVENHWIGVCRDLVMVFAYEGSHDDTRHVTVGVRVVERACKQTGAPVKVLFALPPHHAKPPNADVREAFRRVGPRVHPQIARAAVVVSGTGFAAAVHRGAIAGVLTVVRHKVDIKVVGSIRDGLARLIGEDCVAFQPLLRHCEERVRGPADVAAPSWRRP